jgi:predicted NAD-dependent protein-ADP-ribosyltransferase YbiA (DUF1768 family)
MPVPELIRVEFADPRGKLLSNLALTPFVLDGVELSSVEGFVQGIKFRPGHPNRERIFSLSGHEAREAGASMQREISHRLDCCKAQYVYWLDQEIAFGSDEHHALIARALAAKFAQNPRAREALIGTEHALLIHPRPDTPHTSLPGQIFVAILTEIRSAFAKEPVAA